MSHQQSVLIVDGSAENREVLKLALERRGAQIFEANRLQEGLRAMGRHEPDLIVLDAEASAADRDSLSAHLDESAQTRQIPVVVLGREPRPLPQRSNEQFVAKPYHYRPLIRKIESLLEQTASCYTR